MKKMAQTQSPFKFLAAYEAKDANAFWGRNDEIQKLHELLLATNIVMVYGPSGIGKTSLIQCGLTKKFNGPDWIPLFINRDGDFNQSILSKLQTIIPNKQFNNINDYIEEIYNRYNRPVYLFLDQFEEVFTLAKRDDKRHIIINNEDKIIEISLLFDNIQVLVKSQRCKVVFIIREEFLGQLYKYENNLPSLFDFRLRVEPLNTRGLTEVFRRMFEQSNIVPQTQEVLQIIVEKFLRVNAASQLAYLQIYLDSIWRKVKINSSFKNSKLIVTLEILNDIGTVERVLESYVDEQIMKIIENNKATQKDIDTILKRFITEDGTKRPIDIESQRFVVSATDELIYKELQEVRLIRKDFRYYELAHDSLAEILFKKYFLEEESKEIGKRKSSHFLQTPIDISQTPIDTNSSIFKINSLGAKELFRNLQ